MIVLDTSILIYAVGRAHRFAEPARMLVEAIGHRRVDATTTIEVIQEFAHARACAHGRQDAARHAAEYAQLLSPLVVVERPDLEAGLRLFERHGELGAFDAVLAAVAISRDADALVSTDRGFRAVPRLRLIEPLTPEFDRLIAA